MVLCGCFIYLYLLLLVLNKRGYAKSNLKIMSYINNFLCLASLAYRPGHFSPDYGLLLTLRLYLYYCF